MKLRFHIHNFYDINFANNTFTILIVKQKRKIYPLDRFDNS